MRHSAYRAGVDGRPQTRVLALSLHRPVPTLPCPRVCRHWSRSRAERERCELPCDATDDPQAGSPGARRPLGWGNDGSHGIEALRVEVPITPIRSHPSSFDPRTRGTRCCSGTLRLGSIRHSLAAELGRDAGDRPPAVPASPSNGLVTTGLVGTGWRARWRPTASVFDSLTWTDAPTRVAAPSSRFCNPSLLRNLT